MTDAELVSACLRQDRRAQRTLFERYSPRLKAVALRYVRHPETAEDVLAEAWIKIFTNLGKYTGDGSFEGWLRRITANESLMHLRKRRLATAELTAAVVATEAVPAKVTDRLESADVDGLLATLPEGCRRVFHLYEVDGFKHREIADLLEVSINTSKSQLILAKRKLREAYHALSRREGPRLRPVPDASAGGASAKTPQHAY